MEPRFENISFLHWIYKHIKPLLVVQVIALCLSVIFSSGYFLPKEYKSFAIVYPSNMTDYSHESPSEQMIEFLNSVDVKNQVIEKFDLRRHYNLSNDGKPYFDKLYHLYDHNVVANSTEFEAVELTVYDINPDTAYEMVNYVIEVLNKVVFNVQKEKSQEVANMWNMQLNVKRRQVDSLTNRSRELSGQYGLLEYSNQTREVSRAYYQSLSSGKGSKVYDEVAQQMKNLEEHGMEFRETNQHLDASIAQYDNLLAKYEDAMKDVNKKFTYCNIVSAPYKPDTYTYPIRSLIVLGACFASLVFSILFIRVAEKINPPKVNPKLKGTEESSDGQ